MSRSAQFGLTGGHNTQLHPWVVGAPPGTCDDNVTMPLSLPRAHTRHKLDGDRSPRRRTESDATPPNMLQIHTQPKPPGEHPPGFEVDCGGGGTSCLLGFGSSFLSDGSASANASQLATPSMFPSSEEMKAKVRDALKKPEYNVADFYWTTGLWQKIATNPIFENCTLAVITVNALWISVDTDNNDSAMLLEAQPVFQIAEHFFCVYFTFEWYVRFRSFQRKRNCLKDAWFVFDSSLVGMMVAETWLMTAIFVAIGGGGGGALGNAAILRLLRLLRLSRLARMLRSMPELMILIRGMVAATRSLFFTMCLLLIVIYVYAIALRQLTDGSIAGKMYFGSILEAMYTLLVHGTLLDNLGPVCEDIGSPIKGSPMYLCIFFLFIGMSALMVMNMLIGVLCEVVSAVAATEREEMTLAFVSERLEKVVKALDNDGDMQLSKEEFKKILDNKVALVTLAEVGVDPVGLVDFADFIFADGDGNDIELCFQDFMDMVMEMRSTQTATVKDMMTVAQVCRLEMKKIEEAVKSHRKKQKHRQKQKLRTLAGKTGNRGRSPPKVHVSDHIVRNSSMSSMNSMSSMDSCMSIQRVDSTIVPPTALPLEGAIGSLSSGHTGSASSPLNHHGGAPPSAAFSRRETGLRRSFSARSCHGPIRTEPAEALLMAVATELQKLGVTLPADGAHMAAGSPAGALAGVTPSWKGWASKLRSDITCGLSDLERLQSSPPARLAPIQTDMP
eukprot:TRINITY_DN9276_c0_g4_i1.p1 TRINITY_DN9276_c0_g4~~TRINITY_DN9276_c0_g4_i1.p1  ORF type:complete len:730 (+),score=159.21 TRINITY_DN9276_c0_g4_i1:178-2367(+)